MANANFTCVLDAWRDGTVLYGRMHYYRSGSYYYRDRSFPNPTMNLGGSVYEDVDFGNSVRAGIYVGDVYTTTFSRGVAGTGTRTVTFSAGSGERSDFAGTWSKDVGGFPGTTSPPTDLTFLSCVAGPDYYDVGMSISGWGNGGSAEQRYIEVNIAKKTDSSVDTSHRRFKKAYGVTSATIHVDNTANTEVLGDLTIVPNTIYTVALYATNGAADTGVTRIGNHCSAPPVMTVTVDSVDKTSVKLDYSFGDQGGAYSMFLEYSLDGSNWSGMTTITTSGAQSGKGMIIGLNPGTTYTIRTRLRTNNTNQSNYITNGSTVTVTTKADVKLYGKNPSPNLLNLNNGTIVKRGNGGAWSYTNTANSITMTATGTTGAQYAEWTTDELDPNKTYTISGIAKKIVKGTDGEPGLKIYHRYSDNGIDWSSYSQIWGRSPANTVQGTAYSFSFQESGHKYYRFWFYNNGHTPVTVGESSTYYDLQLETGTSKTSFQPYTGVQGTRRITKLYCKNPSKNLFDNHSTYVRKSGDLMAVASSTGMKTYNTTPLVGTYDAVVYDLGQASDYDGKTITVSYTATIASGGTNVPLVGIGIATSDYSSRTLKSNASGTGSKTIQWTVVADASKPRLILWLYNNSSGSSISGSATTVYVNYDNLMIEVGSTASPYTPYYGPQGAIKVKKLYGSVNGQTKLLYEA